MMWWLFGSLVTICIAYAAFRIGTAGADPYEAAMTRDGDKGWPDPDDHDPDRDHHVMHSTDF